MDRKQLSPQLTALRSAAYALLRREPEHREAHLRLYEIEQMLGTPAAAVGHLRAAVRKSPVVTTRATAGPPERTVLALTRIAPWEANVPLELIADPAHFTLQRLYLSGDERVEDILAHVPAHDTVFNTIAESDDAQPALELAGRIVAGLGEPCINPPAAVARLTRDDVARRFAASTAVIAPAVERLTPATIRERAFAEPIVIRPVGSQAGIGLERIEQRAELAGYFVRHPAAVYYVMPFVDYRSSDGFFRKYRIMFVDGRPLACHLAISPRWMIHYYNAPMSEYAWMREEEAAFLDDLDAVFAGQRGAALRDIAAAVPLQYFGIDCSIATGGQLLLFEADAAMLVHGSDPAGVYPYKRAAFERIKDALTALLCRAG